VIGYNAQIGVSHTPCCGINRCSSVNLSIMTQLLRMVDVVGIVALHTIAFVVVVVPCSRTTSAFTLQPQPFLMKKYTQITHTHRTKSPLCMVLEKPRVKEIAKIEQLKVDSSYLIHPLKEVWSIRFVCNCLFCPSLLFLCSLLLFFFAQKRRRQSIEVMNTYSFPV
jgi:hypothetical protein